MRLQIDFETRMIHILDDISVTDFNMIAFTHKLGDFTFAGLLTDEEEHVEEKFELIVKDDRNKCNDVVLLIDDFVVAKSPWFGSTIENLSIL